MCAVAAAAAALCGVTAPAAASILRVDADRPPGGDGASWRTALHDLQTALLVASSVPAVNEIWVAEGTYTPDGDSGDRGAAFVLVDGLALYGGFAGNETSVEQRDPAAHVTVLSGDLAGDDQPGFVNVGENSLHVVDARGVTAGAILDGFTISGGNADGPCCNDDRGGGMIGIVDLIGCTFRSNRADLGGAIFTDGRSFTASQTRFIDNLAFDDGGALHCGLAMPLLDACAFEGNEAVRGGGLFVDGGAAELIACMFTENTAEFGGGAYNLGGASTVFTRCHFSMNEALHFDQFFARGGAVASIGSSPVFDQCTFSGNLSFSADGSGGMGGALDNDGCTATISDCLFEFNVAQHGAAQRHQETTATVTGCAFNDNLSLIDAGAVEVASKSQVDLLTSTFSGNIAIGEGGAISNRASCAIIDCLLEVNAAEAGGALAIRSDAVLEVIGTTFRGNQAALGGAISCRNGTFEATIASSTIESNRASFDGGGVRLQSCSGVRIIETTMDRNTAEGSGGAIYKEEAGLVVERCTFTGNAAGAQGGGIRAVLLDTLVRGSIFVGNTAAEGGAIFNLGSTTLLDGCTIVGNAAADQGGGLRIGAIGSITNSIIWGNTSASDIPVLAQMWIDPGSYIPITSCDIEGFGAGAGTMGNIASDPLFARNPSDGGDGWGVGKNDDYGDLHLTARSPCIDGGILGGAPAGGVDIDGQPRVQACRPDIGADEASFTPADCNGNGVPDGCETIPPQLVFASGVLAPIGSGLPQSFALPFIEASAGDVTLMFESYADLSGSGAYIDVDINGAPIGRLFEVGATNCAVPFSTAMLIADAGVVNQAAASGAITITMTPSSQVTPFNCGWLPSIFVTVFYEAAAPNDLDDDGIIDACVCPADCAQPPDGIVNVDDLVAVIVAWGSAGGSSDIDGDGVVAVGDLVEVIVSWGPCP